jgi:basic amino acid/polyamine antiporter, APA family
MNAQKIGFSTAVSLVIANMIGTGVFTSLGYQISGIGLAGATPFVLIMLWVIGGIVSLCGSLVYGEIGSVFPASGGEYNYLSRIYHPSVGFLAGWVSATVGFSAPIAMAAMALATYTHGVFSNVNEKVLAVVVIVVITLVHSFNLRTGSLFQRTVTFLKVGIILFIIFAGFLTDKPEVISLLPDKKGWDVLFSGPFAIALFFVTYSYSGWNASAYIAGEIENPKKNLPRSLFLGTITVTAIYVLLNFIFLYTTPVTEFITSTSDGNVTGKQDIGLVAASHIFGNTGGNIMGMIISFLLVSAISAMVMAGPRVIQSMGNDIRLLNFFAITNKNGVPYIAIAVQSIIAIILVLTAKFEFVLQFTAFSLNLFTFLTVLGIFFIKLKKNTEAVSNKLFLFFIPAVLFLAFQVWILYFGFKLKPAETMLGFINLGAGLLFWLAATLFKSKKLNSNL